MGDAKRSKGPSPSLLGRLRPYRHQPINNQQVQHGADSSPSRPSPSSSVFCKCKALPEEQNTSCSSPCYRPLIVEASLVRDLAASIGRQGGGAFYTPTNHNSFSYFPPNR